MRRTYAIYHAPIMELNHDSAMLLGLHAGDGHLSGAWGLSICKKDIAMGEQVVSLVRNVLGVEPGINYRKDGYFIVRSGKLQVFEFFGHYGFRKGRKAPLVLTVAFLTGGTGGNVDSSSRAYHFEMDLLN